MNHPSFLSLDRLALGAPVDADLHQHVAGCQVCREHVAKTRAPVSPPSWLSTVTAPPPRRSYLPLAALAAGLAAIVAVSAHTPEPRLSAKGLPAVTVWVKRGEHVIPWTSEGPVREGDALRLEVAPGDYRYVTVLEQDATGQRTLFETHVSPEGKPTMTPAWEFDGEGQGPHLVVLLSRAPLSEAGARSAVGRRDREIWTIDEVLPKEAP